jgi:hypothetical protein
VVRGQETPEIFLHYCGVLWLITALVKTSDAEYGNGFKSWAYGLERRKCGVRLNLYIIMIGRSPCMGVQPWLALPFTLVLCSPLCLCRIIPWDQGDCQSSVFPGAKREWKSIHPLDKISLSTLKMKSSDMSPSTFWLTRHSHSCHNIMDPYAIDNQRAPPGNSIDQAIQCLI